MSDKMTDEERAEKVADLWRELANIEAATAAAYAEYRTYSDQATAMFKRAHSAFESYSGSADVRDGVLRRLIALLEAQ